ncbi:MAG: cell wall hydrolase [Pseudomonadota bacterium]
MRVVIALRVARRVLTTASFGVLAWVGFGVYGDAAKADAPYGMGAALGAQRTVTEIFRSQHLALVSAMTGPSGASSVALPETTTTMVPRVRDTAAEAARLARLEALSAEDAVSAEMADTARNEVLTELFVADAGGQVDLAMIDQINVGKRDAEWRCMTEALYFEARGERLIGQVAVAEVILNRVDSRRYPDSICAVVRQGMQRKNACQFSYNCDGLKNHIANRKAYEAVGKVAWVMMEGRPRLLTGKATHYHATYVNPDWASRLVHTARIGTHLFYRRPTQLSKR